METKKFLGQHWLSDKASLESMCTVAEVVQGDIVLEVGPGTGTLTTKLLEREATVYAVEKDPELYLQLHATFSDCIKNKKLHLFKVDILEFNLTKLPANYKLVANIPYYLTSHLLRILSESAAPPRVAALLLQKEVARRVCAKPGSMSVLSVATQFYWHASLGMVVPARLFVPPPKVDSQILVLERRKRKIFDVDEKKFFRIVRAGFSSKRKMLPNSIAAGLHISKQEASTLLNNAGLRSSCRPQELSLEQWFDLYTALYKN